MNTVPAAEAIVAVVVAVDATVRLATVATTAQSLLRLARGFA